MSARALREQARLRALGHRDALAALIEDSDLADEHRDAMRHRLRNLWSEATVAMTLVDSMPPKGGLGP